MNYQEEMQKSFLDILETAHGKVYNALIKYKTDKNITNDLTGLLKYLSKEMSILEKDIKIEANDTNQTSF